MRGAARLTAIMVVAGLLLHPEAGWRGDAVGGPGAGEYSVRVAGLGKDAPGPASPVASQASNSGGTAVVVPNVKKALPVTCPAADELRRTAVPPYAPGDIYAAAIARELGRYYRLGLTPEPQIVEYSPTGDFLNWGNTLEFRPSSLLIFDANGIPMIKYGDAFYYNPITIAQFGLYHYGKHVRGDTASRSQFLRVADFLLTQQDARGALPFSFAFKHYLASEGFAPGWTSGMAQGQALSVYARAYAMTKAPKYLNGGNAALGFLSRGRGDGGPKTGLGALDPSLARYTWFEEYPTPTPYYTLNGLMFTMLGLYDWWQLAPPEAAASKQMAHDFFDQTKASVEYVLPYYDVGGFSAYDLGHVLLGVGPNVQGEYHDTHIVLLHALVSITGSQRLACFEQLWTSYVLGPAGSGGVTSAGEGPPPFLPGLLDPEGR